MKLTAFLILVLIIFSCKEIDLSDDLVDCELRCAGCEIENAKLEREISSNHNTRDDLRRKVRELSENNTALSIRNQILESILKESGYLTND